MSASLRAAQRREGWDRRKTARPFLEIARSSMSWYWQIPCPAAGTLRPSLRRPRELRRPTSCNATRRRYRRYPVIANAPLATNFPVKDSLRNVESASIKAGSERKTAYRGGFRGSWIACVLEG
jgi:hypothetical protein